MLTRRTAWTAAAGATVLALTGLLAPAAQAAPRARGGHQLPAFPRKAASTLLADLRDAWRTTKGKEVTVAVIGGRVDRSATGLAGKVVTALILAGLIVLFRARRLRKRWRRRAALRTTQSHRMGRGPPPEPAPSEPAPSEPAPSEPAPSEPASPVAGAGSAGSAGSQQEA